VVLAGVTTVLGTPLPVTPASLRSHLRTAPSALLALIVPAIRAQLGLASAYAR